jgi:DNA primase
MPVRTRKGDRGPKRRIFSVHIPSDKEVDKLYQANPANWVENRLRDSADIQWLDQNRPDLQLVTDSQEVEASLRGFGLLAVLGSEGIPPFGSEYESYKRSR